MRVETERSRNGHRSYSERKYNDRFKRKNSRNDNHHYHSSRISLKSRHHHNKDYSSNRIGNSQSSSYTDHSLTSRSDRQTNNHDIYPSLLTDQTIISGGGPPPPTDLYYHSSQSIRDRGLSSHYIDSERNRYPPPSSSTYRRESSPPPSSSYRNDEYRSPTPLSTRSPYNNMYRASDYQNRSERYDISQNRNYSITSPTSPVYHSDSYQTSSSFVNHDRYSPMREVNYRYGMVASMDPHHRSSSSYRNHSRSNFNENESQRPRRR